MYLQIHHPDWARDYTNIEKNLFLQGNIVQKEARKRFKNGTLIDAPYWEFQQAQQQTHHAIQKNTPAIYEAVFFSPDNLVARIDILEKTKMGWNVIEVKSSMSAKTDHILDVSIQKYVLDQCELKIENYFLMYLNKNCVYPRLENLFCKKNITEEVTEQQSKISNQIQKIIPTLHPPNQIPEVKISPHCQKPHSCRFIPYCWKHIPSPNVFSIPSMGELAWEYYNQNKIHLSDIPSSDMLPRQCHYKDVQLSGKPYIHKANIKKEVSTWEWPLYYLDFETVSPPIPRFEGTHPFQHTPFQWSVLKAHSLKDHETQSFQESHYLHSDLSDPRKPLSEQLIKAIGNKGSVVAYYKQFESLRLKELAELFPEYSEKLLWIESRLVDPLPLLRENVCFKDFGSSWSMKSVAPVLLGDKWNYSHLEVQDGLMAQIQFEQMCQQKDSDPTKKQITKNLIQYCHQDTLCLALIVQWLFQVSS